MFHRITRRMCSFFSMWWKTGTSTHAMALWATQYPSCTLQTNGLVTRKVYGLVTQDRKQDKVGRPQTHGLSVLRARLHLMKRENTRRIGLGKAVICLGHGRQVCLQQPISASRRDAFPVSVNADRQSKSGHYTNSSTQPRLVAAMRR